MRLILGSASPRRRDLLAQIGVVLDEVRPAEIDETPFKGELPRAYVDRMARAMADAVPAGPDELVLAGDKVQVEMTPYDLSKGRITYRFK